MSRPCVPLPQPGGPKRRIIKDRLYGTGLEYAGAMSLSARNQLRGTVIEVELDSIMAHVVVQVGENEIESVITRRSADQMALKVGDMVAVVIKSTEVMIEK
jgi:molybdopterin-binding protein